MFTAADLFRRAGRNNASAVFARAGTEIEYPVGFCGNAHIVLRHDHRIAALNQPVENPHQLVHIRRMQPRGGLVQQIERFTPLYALQLPGELNALAFAAGQFGGGLSQFQVSETKRGKRGKGAGWSHYF